MEFAMQWLKKGPSFLILALVFGSAIVVVAQTGPSAGNRQEAPLAGTSWRLVDLGGEMIPHSGFEPHFILAQGSLSETSDGCNKITGGYEADGNSLRIHVLASTLLVCIHQPAKDASSPDPKNEPESFVKALSGTARFKIHGSTLELQNEDGAVLARMQASRRI